MGQPDQPPFDSGATPVPDLIERYRLRRDAWIAQADELARLRDEVRGSAEREAMEIVTAARRDVRTVVMEARRELLVLSAQVRAALGEVTSKTDPATLLHNAGIAEAHDHGFASEAVVEDILNEVQGDMSALAEEARVLPLQDVRGPAPVPFPVHPPPALSEAASRALLSSPFPSEAVPVRVERSFRTFVGVFVVIGVVVAIATTWWIRNRGVSAPTVGVVAETSASQGPPSVSAPEPSPQEAGVETSPAGLPAAGREVERPRVATRSGSLSLVAEAVRDVWVRTTIDGRMDQGRTLTAGQVIDISAEQSVSLRVGDAGALVVSVNQGEKRPLGREGQVVTRQFVVEGAGSPGGALTPPAVPPASVPERLGTEPPIVAAPAIQVQAPAQVPTTTSAPAASAAVVPSPQVNQVSAPVAPAPRPETAGTANSPAMAVLAVARQWLDAYHRQDRAAMAALSTENLLLADERQSEERFPPGTADVRRTLDRVSVQIAADTAVLTAVMVEQSESAPSPRVSPVSQVWVLAGGGQWKVRQARFVSEARLNQVFR